MNKKLEHLWYEWRSKRRRSYKKFCSKRIRGTFPDVLNPKYKHNVLADFNLEMYEKEKDQAISDIGEKSKEVGNERLLFLQYIITQISEKTIPELAKVLDVSERTIYNWKLIKKKHPELKYPKKNGF